MHTLDKTRTYSLIRDPCLFQEAYYNEIEAFDREVPITRWKPSCDDSITKLLSSWLISLRAILWLLLLDLRSGTRFVLAPPEASRMLASASPRIFPAMGQSWCFSGSSKLHERLYGASYLSFLSDIPITTGFLAFKSVNWMQRLRRVIVAWVIWPKGFLPRRATSRLMSFVPQDDHTLVACVKKLSQYRMPGYPNWPALYRCPAPRRSSVIIQFFGVPGYMPY
jgi:hypothetical protein